MRHLIAQHVGGTTGFGSKLVSKYSGIADQNVLFERDQAASDPVNFE